MNAQVLNSYKTLRARKREKRNARILVIFGLVFIAVAYLVESSAYYNSIK